MGIHHEGRRGYQPLTKVDVAINAGLRHSGRFIQNHKNGIHTTIQLLAVAGILSAALPDVSAVYAAPNQSHDDHRIGKGIGTPIADLTHANFAQTQNASAQPSIPFV